MSTEDPRPPMIVSLQRALTDAGMTSSAVLGEMGVMTASNVLAIKMLALPPADAQAEVATLIRTLWQAQATLDQPLYPDAVTNARLNSSPRTFGRGDSSPTGEG